MITTYQMDVNEITVEVMNPIKSAFKGKTINITVSDAFDETEYLFSTLINTEHLERSIKQAEEGR